MKYTKAKATKQKKFPLKDHPKLVELLTDVAQFTRKYQTPQIADTVGISRQALEFHIDKKEKENK